MLLGPVRDLGQVGPEGLQDHVVAVAHEYGPVADAGEPGDVLDHLGVVVSGEECLGTPPSGMGMKPTKSVSHTCEPRFSSGFSCQ